MEMLLRAGFSNAVAATVLAVFVFAITRVWRNQFAANVLWLIVLLKLVTPPLIEVPLPFLDQVTLFQPHEERDPESEDRDEEELLRRDDGGDFVGSTSLPEAMVTGHVDQPLNVETVAPDQSALSLAGLRSSFPTTAGTIVAFVWFGGSALWILVTTCRICRFDHLLRHHTWESDALQREAEPLAKRLGLSASPQVRLTDSPIAPLLWSSWHRPIILLPAALLRELSSTQVLTILSHELIHLRRRDYWIRRLELSVLVFYWWHPIAWWSIRQLREAEEQCCDSDVLEMHPDKGQYAEALLKTIEYANGRPAGLATASAFGHATQLKKRMSMILQDRLATRLTPSARTALVTMAVILLPLSACGPQNKTETESSPSALVQKTGKGGTDSDASVEKEKPIAEAVRSAALREKNVGRTVADQRAAEAHQDLIHSVERNEKPYKNLELTLTSVYEHLTQNAESKESYRIETQTSIVLQGEKFRRHETQKRTGRPSVAYRARRGNQRKRRSAGSFSRFRTTEAIEVFDGQTHRSFSKHDQMAAAIGNQQLSKSSGQVSDKPPSLTNLARPHMFLIESGCPRVPLSIYLKGAEAVLAHPNPSYFTGDVEVLILGDAEFQGMQCLKILIDTILSDGTRHNGWELWLAKDRNLIPVRKLGYTYRWSRDMPIAESTVDEWKELREGVWFPMKAHTNRYHSQTVKEHGKQVLSWRKQYVVASISFDPKTATGETFSKLDFPPGTEVRVIQGGAETSP